MIRSDARRDYRQFPSAYTELLEAFERNGPTRLGPMTIKEARAARRDFSRFKMFLMRAVDDDHDDYARELVAVFNRASIKIDWRRGDVVHRGAERIPDPAYLILDHNPLVRAVAALRVEQSSERSEPAPLRPIAQPTLAGPYPSCRTPTECNASGYCRRDPACNN